MTSGTKDAVQALAEARDLNVALQREIASLRRKWDAAQRYIAGLEAQVRDLGGEP